MSTFRVKITEVITEKTLKETKERISNHIHRTPILTSTLINEIAGAELFFKCENLQKVGAFKARGAMNAILSLSEEEKQKGVATHSSGNHAQALALAAKLNNIPAYIVMPSTSPKVKMAAVKGYGAQITECEPNQQARESTLEKIVNETGAYFVHPYNNYEVIAGQGTAAMELIEDHPNLDAIVTPVGGGGLLSGTILAAKFFSKSTKVYAGEPLGADDAFRSLEKGEIVPSINPKTIADGLLTSLGDKTFAIIREGVERIIRVDDTEIKTAMKLIWERLKIVVEPSGAVPLAALLKEKEHFKNQKIGIILSGGNMDLSSMFQ